jgi:hypothetical protein
VPASVAGTGSSASEEMVCCASADSDWAFASGTADEDHSAEGAKQKLAWCRSFQAVA